MELTTPPTPREELWGGEGEGGGGGGQWRQAGRAGLAPVEKITLEAKRCCTFWEVSDHDFSMAFVVSYTPKEDIKQKYAYELCILASYITYNKTVEDQPFLRKISH